MSKLNLVLYGDPVLKTRADRIDLMSADTESLAMEMVEVMHDHAGLGLAAPQVGISKRLIVVRVYEDDRPLILLNPEITLRSGVSEREEGCLSLPGVGTTLKRAENIRVRATDLQGKPVELEASGLAARAFQHEVDHIDGILIIDRMGRKEMKEVADHLERIRRGEIPPSSE
jgi:peptide deformylase